MMWKGQWKAILWLAFFGGLGASMFTGIWDIAAVVCPLAVLLWIGGGFVNMLAKAAFGKPVFYDAKTTAGKEEGEAKTSV